jgi:hypothetical protein
MPAMPAMPEPLPPAPSAPPPIVPEAPNAAPILAKEMAADGSSPGGGLKAQVSRRKQMQQSARGTSALRNDLAIGSSRPAPAAQTASPTSGLNIQK